MEEGLNLFSTQAPQPPVKSVYRVISMNRTDLNNHEGVFEQRRVYTIKMKKVR